MITNKGKLAEGVILLLQGEILWQFWQIKSIWIFIRLDKSVHCMKLMESRYELCLVLKLMKLMTFQHKLVFHWWSKMMLLSSKVIAVFRIFITKNQFLTLDLDHLPPVFNKRANLKYLFRCVGWLAIILGWKKSLEELQFECNLSLTIVFLSLKIGLTFCLRGIADCK